jgi:hypothetical protein
MGGSGWRREDTKRVDRSYYSKVTLPSNTPPSEISPNDTTFMYRFRIENLGDLNYQIYLYIPNLPSHFSQFPLGVLECVEKVRIVGNGMVYAQCTGLQLKAYYEWLNPEPKPWQGTRFFPLPTHPFGQVLTGFISLDVEVEIRPFKYIGMAYVLEPVYEECRELAGRGLADLSTLMGCYADDFTWPQCKIITSGMFMCRAERDLITTQRGSRFLPYYYPSTLTVIEKGHDNEVSVDLNWELFVSVLCIVCEHPNRSYEARFLSPAHGDPVPFTRLQLRYQNLPPYTDSDAELWYEFDKIQNRLRMPRETYLYTYTFERPKFFHNPQNLYFTSDSPYEPVSKLSATRLSEFSLCLGWNDETPIGTKAYIWGVVENRMGISGGANALRFCH